MDEVSVRSVHEMADRFHDYDGSRGALGSLFITAALCQDRRKSIKQISDIRMLFSLDLRKEPEGFPAATLGVHEVELRDIPLGFIVELERSVDQIRHNMTVLASIPPKLF